MSTLMHHRSPDRAESLHAYPTLRAAAKFLGVAPSTLSRRSDLRSLRRGERDFVLTPGEVMRLAVIYRKRSLNEVAADLIKHAAQFGTEEADRTEDAVEAFFDARAQSESVEEFLLQARRHLAAELYAEVERTVRAGDGERPTEIVGNVPRLVEQPTTGGRASNLKGTAAGRRVGASASRTASSGSRSKRAAPRRSGSAKN